MGFIARDTDLLTLAARLWPHREHESSLILSQLCRLGFHRWRRLDLSQLAPGRQVAHCFWCSHIKIDGKVHSR